MKNLLFAIVLLGSGLWLGGCSPGRFVAKELRRSEVLQKHFVGFALYDLEKKRWLQTHNADHYFTPASNTKLFTFYTALHLLPDSAPALRYAALGDTLLFWGTGNPALLNPELPPDTAVLRFLRNAPQQLFFCPHNFQDERFGPGWAWDDYPYYYQPEKAPLPLYGNVVHVSYDSVRQVFTVVPEAFSPFFRVVDDSLSRKGRLHREEGGNVFVVNRAKIPPGWEGGVVPFRYSGALAARLLADTLGREIGLWQDARMPPPDAQTLYGIPTDSLYRLLLHHSDNFVAEQLLLLCSGRKFQDTLQTEKIIAWAVDSLLDFLPDPPLWVDGSGLSRYNMFTPRSIVALLERIHAELPPERWQHLFPAGGLSGTIRHWYAGPDGRPYVFAKTGTLRHNHCLSGFLRTRRGKWLAFSFMHNHFPGSSAPAKREMERVLRSIYLRF